MNITQSLQETSMTELVEAFLKADRQWPRHMRIAHAKMQLKQAKKSKAVDGVTFWEAVVAANGTITTQPTWYWPMVTNVTVN